ncbi:8422_t:CDS:2, partial [Gigaspora rosea]
VLFQNLYTNFDTNDEISPPVTVKSQGQNQRQSSNTNNDSEISPPATLKSTTVPKTKSTNSNKKNKVLVTVICTWNGKKKYLVLSDYQSFSDTVSVYLVNKL